MAGMISVVHSLAGSLFKFLHSLFDITSKVVCFSLGVKGSNLGSTTV